jgi:hypothetical protein
MKGMVGKHFFLMIFRQGLKSQGTIRWKSSIFERNFKINNHVTFFRSY